MIKIDFTNKFLEDMKEKKKVNIVHADYYFHMHKKFDTQKDGRFFKKSNRLRDCLSVWNWDKYQKNKLLDLVSVIRCDDKKFCPNCRTMGIATALHNFQPAFIEMLSKGYTPYLMTLTVPNCLGENLIETLQHYNKAYSRFWEWLYKPIGKDANGKNQKGYKNRLVNLRADIEMQEINIQENNHDMYHPHTHSMVFCEEIDYLTLDKHICGGYQRNSKKNIYYSAMDLHIMILWKMAWDNVYLTYKNYVKYENEFESNYLEMENNRDYKHPPHTWCSLYLCDLRPVTMPDGLYEIFKYPFKDKNIYNYNNFETLFLALDGKKMRKCHGELYNLDLEKDCGEKLELEDFLTEKESPETLVIKEIHTLTTLYADFKKISRFKAHTDIDKIK